MLFRFQIELSDVDRGLYESLDFRLAQHPSETPTYLLTRALAYALAYQPTLEFPPGGLADPDAPAMRATGDHGALDLWIDVGNPSARRMHKASKAAKKVMIFTYKNPELLLESMKGEDIYRAREIEIYALNTKMLEQLEECLQKNNRWMLLHQDGRVDIDTGEESVTGEVKRYSFDD